MESYVNKKTLVEDEISKIFLDSVICSLCKSILIKPVMCMKCQKNYCKKCIDNWNENNEKCPNGCDSPNYQESVAKKDIISKFKFRCVICGEEILYDDTENHHDSCSGKKTTKINPENINMKKLSPEETEKYKKEGKEMVYITSK